jgi:protein-arginine kinase activator protein McsA
MSKFCRECGDIINENDKHCNSCGISQKNIVNNSKFYCRECHSYNVIVQVVANTYQRKIKKGILYWLFIGWWLEFLLWMFLTIPRLLFALFVPQKKVIFNTISRYVVCQDCGKAWEITEEDEDFEDDEDE